MDNLTGQSLYAITAVLLSLVSLGLSLVYLGRVVRSYRLFHDDRAAVALAKGVGLMVIALGLMISATGLVMTSSILSVVGLSISRGSFLVLLVTLLLADVRPSSGE